VVTPGRAPASISSLLDPGPEGLLANAQLTSHPIDHPLVSGILPTELVDHANRPVIELWRISTLRWCYLSRLLLWLCWLPLRCGHFAFPSKRESLHFFQGGSIIQSMGTVGDSYDNSMMESARSPLKRELVYETHFSTKDEARRAVFEWNIWYNNERLHSSIDYMSPMELEESWDNQEAA
jgi:transposase InsO family protein